MTRGPCCGACPSRRPPRAGRRVRRRSGLRPSIRAGPATRLPAGAGSDSGSGRTPRRPPCVTPETGASLVRSMRSMRSTGGHRAMAHQHRCLHDAVGTWPEAPDAAPAPMLCLKHWHVARANHANHAKHGTSAAGPRGPDRFGCRGGRSPIQSTRSLGPRPIRPISRSDRPPAGAGSDDGSGRALIIREEPRPRPHSTQPFGLSLRDRPGEAASGRAARVVTVVPAMGGKNLL
jgi:hypothetical protein